MSTYTYVTKTPWPYLCRWVMSMWFHVRACVCCPCTYSRAVWNINYSAMLAAVIKSRGSIAEVWLTHWLTDRAAALCVCVCVHVCLCLGDTLFVAGVLRTLSTATVPAFHAITKGVCMCVCMRACACPVNVLDSQVTSKHCGDKQAMKSDLLRHQS